MSDLRDPDPENGCRRPWHLRVRALPAEAPAQTRRLGREQLLGPALGREQLLEPTGVVGHLELIEAAERVVADHNLRERHHPGSTRELRATVRVH